MARKPRTIALSALKLGDPVEVRWMDAATKASEWQSLEEASKVTLFPIVSRGTLIGVRDDAVVLALDMSLDDKGKPEGFHGVGVIEINSIRELKRATEWDVVEL